MHRQFFEQLYEQHKTGIFRYALSILKSPPLAEDALQETFVRLLQCKGLPFDPGGAQAWLYRVTRNICFDMLRKQKKEAEPVEGVNSEQFGFLDLIQPLTPKEQEIIALKILGNLSHKEIAKILGLTVHGTKKRYERAIHKLRESMKEELI